MPYQAKNEQSYIWHIQKKKWMYGPKYDHLLKFTFHYACPIAMNSSAVLFIGLFYVDPESFNIQYPKPKYTMMYNFESKTWTQQDSLYFENDRGGSSIYSTRKF